MRTRKIHFNTIAVFVLFFMTMSVIRAGQWPVQMDAYRGSTPEIDGVISPGEYDDATHFRGVKNWNPQFNPVCDSNDLSLQGWVKHDGENLYFAFDVTDDVLYGIDTERWLPDENKDAHEPPPVGYPWFGDGIELLINASYQWRQKDGQVASGDGSSWQMVCNLTKSCLGGIGTGGLIEGEPRSSSKAMQNYKSWIETGAMKAVAKPKPDAKGYVIEWMIKPNPCLEIKPGVFCDFKQDSVKMGLNIAVSDLDEKEAGQGNFGNFNHENWWAGEKDKRTWLKQWGTLIIHPGFKPDAGL